jgi:hypothetical protein
VTDQAQWANRIVRYGLEDPEQLCANPCNWRVHPGAQQAAVKGALDDLGWLQDVIVNERSGFVLDGHLRVALALRHGQKSIPVKYVALDEREEALALATLDPLAAMATVDKDKLAELMREASTGEAALQSLLESQAVKAGLIPPVDYEREWQGMPEFEHEDQMAEAAFIIRVFLKDNDDMAALGRLFGKDLTGRKFVWFGKQPRGDTYEAYDSEPV